MVKDKKKLLKSAVPKKEAFIQLIVFKLGQEEFGIRIQQVKEVTLTPAIAKVPKAPTFILGVANIRGDIIAIMDLETRMGIREKNRRILQEKPPKYTLVIENETYSMGLTVQEVPVSLTIPSSLMDKAPDIIRETHINKAFLEGIAKVENRLIIVLNIDNMLSFEEVKELERM